MTPPASSPAADAPLPIEAALPGLRAALAEGTRAVLVAPPGAGKTTRVPLDLADQPWAAAGRILMLEPRRVAARAAADRLAASWGETPGGRVGYRIRGEAKVSDAMRIEVVTEGVLTAMIQRAPDLPGVAAVIFDEAHERSLHADLGLALCLDAQDALRPDLRLLAMSATLEAETLAAAMGDAPILRSDGRMHPVETRWLDAPWSAGGGRRRLEEAAAALTLDALAAAPGDVLVFLPGAGEIRRAAAALDGRAPADVDIRMIYGAMPLAAQRAALAAAPAGRRKVVLATSIAETSLTVEGVRIVVDAGRARRARFDPGSGMTRLVTERASRAEADQRRGRAGRLGPGLCFRMWTRGEEGAAPAHAPPEIETADLAPLALELAVWGVADPAAARLPSPPPEGAWAEARALLADLGALDPAGGASAHGKAMARAPAHPRLAHMILSAPKEDAPTAAAIAALLEERDPLRVAGAPRPPADFALRIEALADPAGFAARRGRQADRGALAAAKENLRRLARAAGIGQSPLRPEAAGRLLARAYPDRVGLRRPGGEPRWILSGGRGAALEPGDGLAGAPSLVAADLDGAGRDAAIRLAAALSRDEIDALFAARITEEKVCLWSRRTREVEARRRRMLGAAPLEDAPWRDAPEEAMAAAMAEGVRDLGLGALPWTPAAERLRARVLRCAAHGAPGADWPDWSDAGLLDAPDRWLTPWLAGIRAARDLARLDLAAILDADLGHGGRVALDRAAPGRFTAPTGESAPIDYGRAAPCVAIRPQELFGLDTHPKAAGEPILFELVSPAGRPIATTADLPGFWRGAWADVRRDLRGRYPRHPWPEDPLAAAPTRRAKPRGT